VNARVRSLILATSAAAAVAVAAAALWFPLRPEIQGIGGIAFWVILTLASGALPVRLPQGTVVSVSAAPLIASVVLGGPFAGAIVALIGTTDSRELRGEVPWYGTLFNHSAVVASVVLGGSVYEVIRSAAGNSPVPLAELTSFLGLLLGSGVYYIANGALAVLAVSARTGTPVRTVWAQDIRAISLNLVGLVPLAWLMAEIFTLPSGVGWWATALFVVPLFTTRLAYHRYVETRELFEQTIRALSKAVDARDENTRNHSARVSDIAEAMCRVLGLPEPQIEIIKWAGLLHDIGKIGIRDDILLKEGPLEKEERILMNRHPAIGADIVAPARQLTAEAPLILTHHEWFNGSGYPNGVEALDIPLGARILGVADAYEAMTSPRPYRKTPLSHEIAIGELRKYSGIQFDPEIVPILIGLDDETLARKPDRPDDLSTMRHAGTPSAPDAPAANEGGTPPSRPALASDDVS
jgi:putative nucleotidyltransferase with HDIG domain